MKRKHFFLFASAVAMLTACSSEDLGTTETSKQAIRFDVPFVGKTTRSTGDLNNTNISNQSIKVWGDEYSDGATTGTSVFSGEGDAKLSYAGSVWDVDKIAFWDEGMKYDFLAVAPYNLANVSYGTTGSSYTIADRKLSIADIPAVKKITDGDDILVAAVNEQSKGANADNGVQFNFSHILSRFSVYAYTAIPNDEPTGYTVKLNSLSIYLPNDKAKAKYTQATHGEVDNDADTWEWGNFTNAATTATEADLANDYTKYDLNADNTTASLQYAATLADARQAAKNETTKASYLLQPEFFVAPTTKIEASTTADLQLFMKITYTLTGKGDNQSKEYTKFVPIQDLHSFKQGHQTNLFICIGEGDIEFGNFSVNGWQNAADAEHDFK